MPNFKPKASKKIVVNKKSIVTLDSKHNEKMKEFIDISNNKWFVWFYCISRWKRIFIWSDTFD